MWGLLGILPPGNRRLQRGLIVLGTMLASMTGAGQALAGPGYALDSTKASISAGAELPRGVAIDQASQMLYVTELTTNRYTGAPGQIEQYTQNGNVTANSPFKAGNEAGTFGEYFVGVAVNPTDQSIYAYQARLNLPSGSFGKSVMSTFSSTGLLGPSFPPSGSAAPQIAADAAGRVYLPNVTTESIQVFNSTGTLLESIACGSCPGGAFDEPVSVALDSAGNLYAVDAADGGRVIKFALSAGEYVYSSILQSGAGAAAIGVDPSNDTIFVGDASNGYHIVAYASSGVQIDDFGAGLFAPLQSKLAAGQIAANSTTHKVYVADPEARKVWIFERIASIPAPSVVTNPASQIGQLEANLNATVNPQGHGLTACSFKFSEDADYQLHGFANATVLPCSPEPSGSRGVSTSVHLSGLSPATKYDFRITASSNGGAVEGAVLSFGTLDPLPPEVTPSPAVSITQTTAKLVGAVNPKGGVISDCQFEFLTRQSFEAGGFAGAKKAQCSPRAPSGTSSTVVTAAIGDLSAATEYRFRLAASSNSGRTETSGTDFITPADTCETRPALCPTMPVTPISTPAGGPPPPPAAPLAPPKPKPVKCRKGFVKKRVHGKLKCMKRKRRR